MYSSLLSVSLLSFANYCYGWPDGAPCINAVFESMNPLEAVEHQGGLQLTEPPYNIEVRQKCYRVNQPIELTLKGNTSTDRFRGFAIQPISYKGPNRGHRVGQFLRLDDNGSWQQQCYRFKDSVTHSHDEKKKHIKLWWKTNENEVDDDYIQFVATVVKAQKEFWVKAVKSLPIPPCRLEINGVENYIPDPITPPPPVKQFKLDVFRQLDAPDDDLKFQIIDVLPDDGDRKPKPQKVQDVNRVMRISNRRRIRPAGAVASPTVDSQTTQVFATLPFQNQLPQTFSTRIPHPTAIYQAFVTTVESSGRQAQATTAAPRVPSYNPPNSNSPQDVQQQQQTQQQYQQQLYHYQQQQQQYMQQQRQYQQQQLYMQLRYQQQQQQRLTEHFIPRTNVEATQQQSIAAFAQQTPSTIVGSAQVQPQQIRSQFRSPSVLQNQTVTMQRFFSNAIAPHQISQTSIEVCVDLENPELCINHVTLCYAPGQQFMQQRCRRTCRFC